MRSFLQFLPLVPALTSAFLIPSNLDAAVEKVKDLAESAAVPFVQQFGVDPFHQKLEVECKACPSYEAEMDGKVFKFTPKTIALDFVADPSQPMNLKLNSHDLFRMTKSSLTPLTAVQTSSDNLGRIAYQQVQLDFELYLESVSQSVRRARLHILRVDGVPTHKLMDIVELAIVQDANDVLYIAKADVRAPTKFEASAARCKMNMLCRWKAYFHDKVKGLKNGHGNGRKRPGCHGKGKGSHGNAQSGQVKTHNDRPAHHSQEGHPHHPSENRPHHPHGHHHRGFGKVMHVVKAVFFFAFLPLLAGTIAGLFVSFVGLLASHVVVMTYRLATGKPLRSNKVCGYSCDKEIVEALEEEGLLDAKIADNDEELPAYTDSNVIVEEKSAKLEV